MKRTLTIIVGFGLLSAAGCSSGGLTTREKGAGMARLAALQSAVLSGRLSDDPVQARRLVER